MAALVLALRASGPHGRRCRRRGGGAGAAADRHARADRSSSNAAPRASRVLKRCGSVSAFKRWGLRTLGELAALPAADLVGAARARRGCAWQAIARGEDIRPLVPTLPEERFESSLELEWPIEGLEPLSFVLTRLLEPLSTRLERRDRGAAVLHVAAAARSRRATVHARRLELPSPMRDVRTLRTLALLDLESHPPPAPIDRVTVVDRSDARPRAAAHAVHARAPDARAALDAARAARRADGAGPHRRAGDGRFVPPGAFAMTPFATEHRSRSRLAASRAERVRQRRCGLSRLRVRASRPSSALRRCRQPVPARVVARATAARCASRPIAAASPAARSCTPPVRGGRRATWWDRARRVRQAARPGAGTADVRNRDEWDVALSDGGVYRIFRIARPEAGSSMGSSTDEDAGDADDEARVRGAEFCRGDPRSETDCVRLDASAST